MTVRCPRRPVAATAVAAAVDKYGQFSIDSRGRSTTLRVGVRSVERGETKSRVDTSRFTLVCTSYTAQH